MEVHSSRDLASKNTWASFIRQKQPYPPVTLGELTFNYNVEKIQSPIEVGFWSR